MSKAFSILALALFLTAPALAQDEEDAGESREGYAWGEGARAAEGEDPLRIQASAGAGFGVRLLRNLDPPFNQDFLTPPYLDIGAAVFLPGAEIRHGVGLGLSTSLADDVNNGVGAGQQWSITPAYYLMIPLRRLVPDLGGDWVQIQAHIGVPIVLGSGLGTGEGVDLSVGLELGVTPVFKFLAGLGLYLDVQFAFYGGTNDTVHPMLAFDLGLIIDYEVLP